MRSPSKLVAHVAGIVLFACGLRAVAADVSLQDYPSHVEGDARRVVLEPDRDRIVERVGLSLFGGALTVAAPDRGVNLITLATVRQGPGTEGANFHYEVFLDTPNDGKQVTNCHYAIQFLPGSIRQPALNDLLRARAPAFSDIEENRTVDLGAQTEAPRFDLQDGLLYYVRTYANAGTSWIGNWATTGQRLNYFLALDSGRVVNVEIACVYSGSAGLDALAFSREQIALSFYR